MLFLYYTDIFQMSHEPSLNLSSSSSSSKDDGKNNDGNADNELAEPSNEEMEKKKNFGRFD